MNLLAIFFYRLQPVGPGVCQRTGRNYMVNSGSGMGQILSGDVSDRQSISAGALVTPSGGRVAYDSYFLERD